MSANPSMYPLPPLAEISHAVVPGRRFSAMTAVDSTPFGPRNVRALAPPDDEELRGRPDPLTA
jgi:hypothetical protein